MPPKAPPPKKKEALPEVDTSQRARLFTYLAMQTLALAVLIGQLNKYGVLDILGTFVEVYNPLRKPCGWLLDGQFLLLSQRIVLPHGVAPGYVHVRGSMIAAIGTGAPGVDRHVIAQPVLAGHKSLRVLDYGDKAVSPGLIDVHVHMDEPGREHWEGFETGTRAAAAGGFTTLVDMPLNSHPCTTTKKELHNKILAAKGKVLVDTAFWAGLVPQNAHTPSVLRDMIAAGALGFKAFMSPSGIDDFDNVSVQDVAAALPVIKALGVPLLVHAELVDEDVPSGGDAHQHSTWLASRPRRFEKNAIRALIQLLKEDTTPAEPGFHLHIVHLSDAEMLPELAAAKAAGLPLSVETCPHYLNFVSEDVPEGDTRFKCAPPIREAGNLDALWAGLAAGTIDALSTDHSPAEPALKLLEEGDFMKAWGGIAGLQYALPGSWDGAERHGLNLTALAKLWSQFPAELAGLSKKKGRLRMGLDADIVVWDPEAPADTSPEALQHRHKFTPYDGRRLLGRVEATFVRGRLVFQADKGPWAGQACGRAVLKKKK